MKRLTGKVMIASSLSFTGAPWLLAQSLSVDHFLAGVSKHFVGDEVEQAQSSDLGEALNTAPPAEVEKVLPTLVRYMQSGNEVHARGYAVMFLLPIALRPDGADLLASRSHEISSLILDPNPGTQNMAVATTGYVIATPSTNKRPYVAALETAIQTNKTPQNVTMGMVGPLLYARFTDPSALMPVLGFMRRDDLTPDTRRELVHSLGGDGDLPEEVNQLLVKELSDPDPTVRVAALVSYADSTTAFHTLGKPVVEKMANDPQENPKVRELAKQAIAGKTNLNQNVLVPNVEIPPEKPNNP